MRKLFSLFMALLATTSLWAHDFEVDGIYYNWYFDGGDYLEVTYCGSKSDSYSNEYSGSVEIPAIIYDDDGTAYNVIRIHAGAFSDCSSLTSITIPNSVTSIGDHAFDGCSSLTSVTIPNSVTSIANRCFQDCSSLTSITIPNSVTSIGFDAFSDCSSLTSITIPNNVTSIGRSAFSGCSSLTSITIPNNVTSIGRSAFSGCSSLTSVVVKATNTIYDSRNNCNAIIETATNKLIAGCQNTIIPNSVTSIGDHAFSGCALASVVIPDGVTSIGELAFHQCSSLTSVTIPNSVTSIGRSAFSFCSSLTSITIPNSVTSIEDNVFSGCDSFTSITIPNSVTSIGFGAFSGCSSLTSITIPNSVTSIGDHAFWSCINLSSVAIPNSVTSIGVQAFCYCFYLTDLTIGSGVTSIGEEAFIGCRHLEKINVHSIIPPNVSGNTFDYYDAELYVPCDSKQAYEAHPIFGKFKNIKCLDDSNGGFVTTHIHDTICQGDVYEFGEYLCDTTGTYTAIIGDVTTFLYLTVLPRSVDTIVVETNDSYMWHNEIYTESGEYKYVTAAANGCDSIEVLYLTIIPSDNPDIARKQQIYYTSSDGNIVNPTNANGFGANIISNTYENGQGIITFDGPVTSIRQEAFYACTSLTSISIPNSVTTIGHLAFTGCSSLTSITIPKSVTDIGKSQVGETYRGPVFTYCPALTSIVVEEGNPMYDSRDNCNAIIQTATNTLIAGCQNTTIPNSTTSIGDYAFNGCSSLTSITIPNHITNIQSNPFLSCSSLATIVVESGNPIYDSRDNCNAIIESTTNVLLVGCQNTTIPNSVTSIGGLAFYGCSSLTVIAIPENVTSIGSSAFHGCSSLTSITIPEGVTSIEPFTFYGCSSLTSINIPENVTSIGVEAFEWCSSLTSINIPENVTSIGDGAFSGCSSLNAIYCYIVTPIQITPRTFGSSYNKAILYVPCESLDAYLADKVWERFDNIQCIGDEIPKVGNSIYYTSSDGNIVNPYKTDGFDAKIISNTYENGRGTITFDGLVGSIRDSAFYSCHRLTSITIPKYVDEIGAYAFYECSLLYSITCLETTPPSALDSSRPKLYSFQNYDATVYVPCEALEAYKEHRVWSKFADIQCFEDSVPDTPKRVLSCAEAVIVCLETGATATTEEYTIHGYVTEITTEYSEQYKNISFYMADTKDGGQVLFTYRIKPMYEADIAVKVGDFVEVVGKLVNYNGYLPEVYPGVYTIVNEPELPMGTSDIQLPTSNTKKVVKDGQLLILRDGKTYNVMGQEL